MPAESSQNLLPADRLQSWLAECCRHGIRVGYTRSACGGVTEGNSSLPHHKLSGPDSKVPVSPCIGQATVPTLTDGGPVRFLFTAHTIRLTMKCPSFFFIGGWWEWWVGIENPRDSATALHPIINEKQSAVKYYFCDNSFWDPEMVNHKRHNFRWQRPNTVSCGEMNGNSDSGWD